MGVCYYNLDIYTKALDEFIAAYKYDHDCIDALINQGIIYMDLEDFVTAIDIFYKIIVLFPKSNQQSFIHLYLGTCNYYLQNYNLALKELDLAYTLDNMCFDALKYKGLLYVRIKEYEKALIEFTILNDIRPDLDNYINLSYSCFKLNDFHSSYNWIVKAIDINSEHEYANKLMKNIKQNL